MQTAAEQRSHLLGGHRIAGGQAIDHVQAAPAVSLCMLIVTPTRRGYMPLERSGRPELLPTVHGVSDMTLRRG
jgi:hypothetical protein